MEYRYPAALMVHMPIVFVSLSDYRMFSAASLASFRFLSKLYARW